MNSKKNPFRIPFLIECQIAFQEKMLFLKIIYKYRNIIFDAQLFPNIILCFRK